MILVRMLNLSSEVKWVILQYLLHLSKKIPLIFQDKITNLYICSLEKVYIKELKIQILAQSVSDSNFSMLLDELSFYAK